MQYQFSASFLSEIVRLAKEIAFYQRGERKLQDEVTLIRKYHDEIGELNVSEHPEEELPDVVYYACCLAAQGVDEYIQNAQEIILPEHGLSQQQIEAITLAKYGLRAERPNSKDFERERAAIQAALL
jgi:hypothetical protein